MDGRAWWAAVHGVTQSQTQLKWQQQQHFSLSCNRNQNVSSQGYVLLPQGYQGLNLPFRSTVLKCGFCL